MDERQGHFALLQVAPLGLAGGARRREVEQVVLDLERDANGLTEGAHVLHPVLVGAGAGRPGGATGCDERGRLAPDDVEVDVFGDVQAAGLLDLEQLPLAHRFHRAGGDAEQVHGVPFHRDEQSPGEQVVPDEHGDLGFPEGIDGEEPPAGFRPVDHVVVDEGGRVEQFDEGGGHVAAVGGAPQAWAVR